MKLTKSIFATLPFIMVLAGCSQTTKTNTTYVTPVAANCSVASDCILTTKLYHPCGTVFAINKNTSESEINNYNTQIQKEFSNKEFDCPEPPEVKDFKAQCVQQKCVATKL